MLLGINGQAYTKFLTSKNTRKVNKSNPTLGTKEEKMDPKERRRNDSNNNIYLKKKKEACSVLTLGTVFFSLRKLSGQLGHGGSLKVWALASNFVWGTVGFYGATNVKDLTAGNDR